MICKEPACKEGYESVLAGIRSDGCKIFDCRKRKTDCEKIECDEGKELIYTGRIIDAAEAERLGIVDKVVPPDKLEEEVEQLAETIASKSPIIIKLVKRTINRGMYTDLAAGLAYEKSNFALCFATEDHTEGITAFLEKRKPEFKGR